MQNKKTVLSDRFLIGEELGRGAYGQVFKGMDANTGDVVAIKQISLSGVSQENLQSVMGEIDLLKTLNHKNIVKYIGSFKTRTHLYIILEFMENGSLSSVIKPNRFGVFPESLVAIYITQVLQGLVYLHEQGVVHRDIKGANILTTKEGLVKLADFGVAAKLGELENGRDELQQNVVGTPYWMAPEVIEMTQVTAASDIWSVGCLILELLTGYPPYYDLQPMSALFRIVQDDHPPLPENVSPLLDEFLIQCFQKDPTARPDARTLLQHEWIQYNRRTLRSSWTRAQGYRARGGRGGAADAHESVTSVVERMLVNAEAGGEEDGGGAGGGGGAALYTLDAAAGPLATQTPLALALQQDLGAEDGPGPLLPLPPPQPPSPLPAAASRLADPKAAAGGSPQARLAEPLPASIELSSSGLLPPPQPQEQLLQRRASGAAAGTSGQARTVDAPAGWQQQQPQQQQQQHVYREHLPQANGPGPPPPALSLSPREREKDAAGNDWDGVLGIFLSRLQGGDGGAATPTAARLAQQGSNLTTWLDEADRPSGPPGRSSLTRTGNSASGGGYLDSGGYQGLYDTLPPLAPAAAGARWGGQQAGGGGGQHVAGGGGGHQLYGRNLSSNSLSDSTSASSGGALEGPQESAFALETKRKVRDLVRSLRPGARDANMTPAQACGGLASLFARHPESKQHFLGEGGVLAAMEMLDSDTTKILEPAVDLVCAFTAGDTRLLESLCLVGIVPAMCRMALPAPPGAERLRARAAAFVQQLCFSGVTTLQMLIACGGLRHLVLMVQDNLQDPASLTPTGVACIWRALEAHSALPINYICRLLAQAGLVPRLFSVLRQAVTLQARSDRQQQQQQQGGASRHGYVAGNGSVLSKGWAADGGGGGGAEELAGAQAAASAARLDREPSASAAPRSPLAMKEAGGLAGTDELQLRQAGPRGGGAGGDSQAAYRRTAPDLDQNGGGGGAGAQQGPPAARPLGVGLEVWQLSAAPGQPRIDWVLEKGSSLLLVMAHADSAVKATMCSKDALQSLLDCLQRLQPPHLVKVMRALRWLTGEASVLPAIKDAGTIGQLVPFLSREREAAVGPEAQLEALHALYNICKFNKRVHLEVAATAGIVQHLCRFAVESSPPPPQPPAALDPLSGPAAAESRRAAVRGFVVPMLIGMASTSSSTRAKLWACSGLDIFLQLLGEEDPQMQVGLLRALDTWLAEDHTRVEHRLVAREAVAQLVELFALACRQRDMATMPQMLDILKIMLGRSAKLSVAMATGGLVPPLLEPLASPPGGGAPILRARLLEILRALYEHHPRPKEFIMKFRIQDVLRRLLENGGRGEDAVKVEAHKLLDAFHINVLL